MLKKNVIWLCLMIGVIVTACSISYKFNGASIDYTKVKTITVRISRTRLLWCILRYRRSLPKR